MKALELTTLIEQGRSIGMGAKRDEKSFIKEIFEKYPKKYKRLIACLLVYGRWQSTLYGGSRFLDGRKCAGCAGSRDDEEGKGWRCFETENNLDEEFEALTGENTCPVQDFCLYLRESSQRSNLTLAWEAVETEANAIGIDSTSIEKE